METPRPDVHLGFTQKKFPAGTHICLIYDSEGERRSIIEKYVAAGVDAGDRVAYFTDSGVEEALEWLAETGVAAGLDQAKGRVRVSAADLTYCPDGYFDPDAMLDILRTFRCEADGHVYNGARVTGEMTWAQRGIPGSDRLMEYESKLNNVLPECGVTGICQYDANRWDGETILNVLRVHPMMVIRGHVLENPYYMTPEEYLRQYSPGR